MLGPADILYSFLGAYYLPHCHCHREDSGWVAEVLMRDWWIVDMTENSNQGLQHSCSDMRSQKPTPHYWKLKSLWSMKLQWIVQDNGIGHTLPRGGFSLPCLASLPLHCLLLYDVVLISLRLSMCLTVISSEIPPERQTFLAHIFGFASKQYSRGDEVWEVSRARDWPQIKEVGWWVPEVHYTNLLLYVF